MTLDEYNKLVKEFISHESRIVNCASDDDLKEIAIGMTKDHRTLVQKKMKMFMFFIEELDRLHKADCFDLRNEAACKLATAICEKFDKYDRCMPLI